MGRAPSTKRHFLYWGI